MLQSSCSVARSFETRCVPSELGKNIADGAADALRARKSIDVSAFDRASRYVTVWSSVPPAIILPNWIPIISQDATVPCQESDTCSTVGIKYFDAADRRRRGPYWVRQRRRQHWVERSVDLTWGSADIGFCSYFGRREYGARWIMARPKNASVTWKVLCFIFVMHLKTRFWAITFISWEL